MLVKIKQNINYLYQILVFQLLKHKEVSGKQNNINTHFR